MNNLSSDVTESIKIDDMKMSELFQKIEQLYSKYVVVNILG